MDICHWINTRSATVWTPANTFSAGLIRHGISCLLVEEYCNTLLSCCCFLSSADFFEHWISKHSGVLRLQHGLLVEHVSHLPVQLSQKLAKDNIWQCHRFQLVVKDHQRHWGNERPQNVFYFATYVWISGWEEQVDQFLATAVRNICQDTSGLFFLNVERQQGVPHAPTYHTIFFREFLYMLRRRGLCAVSLVQKLLVELARPACMFILGRVSIDRKVQGSSSSTASHSHEAYQVAEKRNPISGNVRELFCKSCHSRSHPTGASWDGSAGQTTFPNSVLAVFEWVEWMALGQPVLAPLVGSNRIEMQRTNFSVVLLLLFEGDAFSGICCLLPWDGSCWEEPGSLSAKASSHWEKLFPAFFPSPSRMTAFFF